jgi:hypothetical protein
MPTDVIAAFNDRVLRRVREGLQAYRDELKAISHQMAARGLASSGPHLVKRLETFKRWMETVTDQCFEEVTRLPGTQSMHREFNEPFLSQQLLGFFIAAKPDIFFTGAPETATKEIERQTVPIRENLDRDLRDFKAGLWRPRVREGASSLTHNTINIHSSNVGAVLQAGERSVQTATVTFNAQLVQSALEDLAFSLQNSDLPGDTKSAAMIEIDTIRPQLKKPSPNASIVQEALRSLRNIMEGVAAGILAAKLMALLTAAGLS